MCPGASPGAARIPKKECAIDPINPCGELALVLALHPSKIEHILLDSRPFGVLQGVILLSSLISQVFAVTLLELANKTTFIYIR